jgi:ParB family chromosome partitioning protein
MGHGRAIINDLDIQTDIYQNSKQNLSVRDTEALVKNYQDSLKPKAAIKAKTASYEVRSQKKAFSNYFGNKVDV